MRRVGPRYAAFAFTGAAIAAFLAHEPATVLLGLRGTRAKREEAARAWRWIAVEGAVAIACGVVGLALDARARPFAFAVLACGAIASLFLHLGKERTVFGEMIVACALAGAAAPVGAASGLSTPTIAAGFAIWIAQVAASTVAVRVLIGQRGAWRTIVVAAAALGGAAFIGRWFVIALVPTCAVCAAVALSSLTVRSIRALGYALAIAMTMSGVLLVVAARS